ncbi:hypothetical protein WICMUC_004454 [Wickerhamomyces mucosus]|uniref:DNA replication regulator Sld3 C-terminal domain-containing protein n=1 Tax=Wickerhamomyces mucosus TaxID=1378264 RepID=A0A9P8PH05_9ASCO|nr:hypothetical protein WICMUC_004454 [Wickerhamomyces mucosus]
MTKFTIKSNNLQSQLEITLLKPTNCSLSEISSNLIHNKPNRYFQIKEQNVLNYFENQSNYQYLIEITKNNKIQYGILSKLVDNYFVLKYLNNLPIHSNSKDSIDSSSQLSSNYKPLIINDSVNFHSNWIQENIRSIDKINDYKLSMDPPNSIQISPLKKNQPPFDYFEEKYYENLYQLTIPLTYFTKSCFQRLFNLCGKDEFKYESILKKFVLKINEFDQRHDLNTNGLFNKDLIKSNNELENQQKFIDKYLNLIDINGSKKNDSLITIINNFKIKELHIQIIVLLELISLRKLDDSKLFISNEKSKKNSKTSASSFIRKKRSKNNSKKFQQLNLVPVINGGIISSTTQLKDSTDLELTYNQLLDSYIGKLMIYDALLQSSSIGINDLTSQDSSTQDNLLKTTKFITNIVIPFFEKRVPHSVKHLIKKVKGSSFKSQSQRKPAIKSTKDNNTNVINKHKLEVKKPAQFERTSFKLQDIEEFKSKSLSRSNSELSRTLSFSSINLSKKKQIDLSLPQIDKTKPKLIKSNSTSIFNRVGKKKNNQLPIKPIESFSQVNETPMKKIKPINILETPLKSIDSSSPINLTKLDKNSAKLDSINSPDIQIAHDIKSIGSISQVNETPINSSKLKHKNNSIIMETPLKSINSSPLKSLNQSTKLEDQNDYVIGELTPDDKIKENGSPLRQLKSDRRTVNRRLFG